MSAKQPAFMFYTGDWLKDPALSVCAPATRGIWIDLLSRMHENDRSGIVTGSVPGLAASCRCSDDELRAALVDLVENQAALVTVENEGCVRDLSGECPANVRDLSGLFPHGRHGHVTVVCKRMKREYEARCKALQRKQLERERKKENRNAVARRH